MKPFLPAICALGLLLPVAVHADRWKDALNSIKQAATQPGGAAGSLATLSDGDIAKGLREALAQGTRTAVNNLGRSDGFWGNLAARVPMPPALNKLERTLRGLGLGATVDGFHLTLNRAAEQAVPVAADVFAQSVQKLSLSEVRGILTGPQDAATQYFRRTAGEALAVKFRPLVTQATARVGVTQSYKQMVKSAGPLAGALGAQADLDGYVTQKALDGLFVQVAAEEARIRSNPAARGSEILKKVFGAK